MTEAFIVGAIVLALFVIAVLTLRNRVKGGPDTRDPPNRDTDSIS